MKWESGQELRVRGGEGGVDGLGCMGERSEASELDRRLYVYARHRRIGAVDRIGSAHVRLSEQHGGK